MAISNMEHSLDKTIQARTQAPCRRPREIASAAAESLAIEIFVEVLRRLFQTL
jgi:hypothetical protein